MFFLELLRWLLWALVGYIGICLFICFLLFVIARCKGWNDPTLTPEEILNRLMGGK